jgi:hypothetical protein
MTILLGDTTSPRWKDHADGRVQVGGRLSEPAVAHQPPPHSGLVQAAICRAPDYVELEGMGWRDLDGERGIAAA